MTDISHTHIHKNKEKFSLSSRKQGGEMSGAGGKCVSIGLCTLKAC